MQAAVHRRRPAHRRTPGRRLLRGRTQRLSLAVALLGLVAALAPVPSTPASASLLDPCGGDYRPALTGSTVNQGLGTYDELVRGKTTLVRLFLTAPACAGLTSTVQLVGAQVQVLEGGTVITTGSTTPGQLGPDYPVLPAADQGSGDDGPWNPLVRLPALGGGSAPTTSSTLSFRYRLTYQYRQTPTSPFVQVEEPTSAWRDLTTATMAPRSAPMRVLLVPLGDASAERRTQLPTLANGGTPVGGKYADQVAMDAMEAAARVMPVADGLSAPLAPPTSSTAPLQPGFQYELLSSAMVDLGPAGLKFMPSGGKVCMTASKFVQPPPDGKTASDTNVSAKLSAHMAAWNKNNSDRQVSRVMGVLWQGISGGTAGLGDGLACAEGMASVDGATSFIRLLAPSVVTSDGTDRPNPSMSGALAAMELSHNVGAAVGAPRADSSFHSVNSSADPGGTRRAYDVSQPRWVPDARSALRYTGTSTGYTSPSTGRVSPWNDTNVLLERQDQAHLLCELSPTTSSTCPSGATSGGATVAGATAGLVIAGTTKGTAETTDFVSYYDSTVQPTRPAPGSGYRLVLRDEAGRQLPACAAGSEGCTQGELELPVSETRSVHDHEGSPTSPHQDSGVRSLYAAVAVDPLATSFEVWNTPPSGAQRGTCAGAPGCLYARGHSSAPVVAPAGTGHVLSGLDDLSKDDGDETFPAVSPRGTAVAWQTATGIVVQLRDTTTGAAGRRSTVLEGAREPAWSPALPSNPDDPFVGELAYGTADGDIERVRVTRLAGTPTFGTASRVYDHRLQTAPVLDPRASSPTWAPDGSALAVVIGEGIWRIANGSTSRVFCDLARLVATSTCRQLVPPGSGAAQPDWGAGLVAYQRGGLDPGVYTVDPDASDAPRNGTLRIAGAEAPSFGGGLLAYTQGGRVGLADASGDGQYPVRLLTDGGKDSSPALARGARVLALSRDLTGKAGKDVHVGTLDLPGDEVRFTATTDGDPALLRADVLLACGRTQEPVLAGLRPTSTEGRGPGTATFASSFDRLQGCPGGTLAATVSNGWDSSELVPLRTYPVRPTPLPPTPTITTPASGARILQYEPLVGVASTVERGDGTNGGATTITWRLTGPGGSGYTGQPVGTSSRLQVDPRVPGGHVPGTYVVTATATTPSGASGSATSTVVVLPDPGHRGVNATVTFDPKTLYVPSNGQSVTMRVRPHRQQLANVPLSSVRAVLVGDHPADLPAHAWTANADGTWTAKLNRSALSDVIVRHGLVGKYVQVVLRGGSGADAFVGADPQYPVTSPS